MFRNRLAFRNRPAFRNWLARPRVWLATQADTWIDRERGRFVLFLPVFMAAGVITYFSLRAEPALWLLLVTLCLAAGACALLAHAPVARMLCLAAAFAIGGMASARLATWRAAPWDSVPHTATIVSGAAASVDALPTGLRVTIAAPSLDGAAPAARSVRIRLRNTDTLRPAAGDTIRVRALLRAPAQPAYPGGWDLQRDAYFAGMNAYGFAIGPAVLLAHPPHSNWQLLRERIAATIMAALPGERGAIAATLVTGLATAIPADSRAAFQASGLSHLLAVAGLHIGIVMGLVFAAVRLALTATEYTTLHWPVRRIASITALAGGAFYLALTGAHVPILRSFAMASLVTLAVVTGRRAISLRALALAALVLMLFAPDEVLGVSFQMSFAAVLALVAGWEALRPFLRGFALGRWWRAPALYVGGLAFTSAVAGTASLPFAAYHFGNAALWYVPANMLAVPLTALWVMPWGLAALLLMPFGASGVALAPMGWGISGLLAMARAVAAWPGALTPVPQMHPAALLTIAAGLIWLCLWRTRLRLAGIAPMLGGLIMYVWQPLPGLFVAKDGFVVAARIGGTVFTETRAGASIFDKESPSRIWGAAAFAPFVSTAAGTVRCDARSCGWDDGTLKILLLRDPDFSCRGADIALATSALRGCGAGVVIDRHNTARDGGTLVTAGTVATVRAARGDRPWVIRERPVLPPARTE